MSSRTVTSIVAIALVLAGCNGSDTGDGSASASTSDSTTTSASGTTGAGSMSATGSTAGSGSDSATTGSSSESTSSASASTSSGGSTTAGTTDGGTTGTTGTTDGGTTGTTDGGTTGTSGTTEGITSTSTGTTGPDCIPAQEVCNDLDDDCNGFIDDVDVGKDGICDCLNIALVGNEGANPSAEFQAWLEAQGTQVDRIQTTNTPLDKATLAKYDIIILDWLIRSYTAEEATLTREWVEAGGGLMSMTGHSNNNSVVDRPNSLIKPMGLSYNASKGFFSGPITTFFPHPITDTLTSISFYGGLYVDIVEDGVGKNAVIMTLPQGPVGVVQERIGGRLFIFGDEWIEFDSEWKNIPQIKKFWVQTLAWLGPQDSCLVPQ